jgi:hypothetical protein
VAQLPDSRVLLWGGCRALGTFTEGVVMPLIHGDTGEIVQNGQPRGSAEGREHVALLALQALNAGHPPDHLRAQATIDNARSFVDQKYGTNLTAEEVRAEVERVIASVAGVARPLQGDQGAEKAGLAGEIDPTVAPLQHVAGEGRGRGKPPALAFEPDIPGAAYKALHRYGVVGEEKVVRLIYIVTTSRLLAKIVSLVVMGPSSVGKSHVVNTTLRLVPESATYILTSMSAKALVYETESLQHRMIVFCEAAALNDNEHGAYLLRSLVSEGRLRHSTVDPKTLQSIVKEREGPTGVIVTTTATRLEAELQTRMLAVTANDTPEQTKAVLAALADDGPAAQLDVGPWHELQEWLEAGPREVAIPFAARLAELVDPVAVRLRRDFGNLLALIRAHALLHRATRELDAKGRIVATIEDYRAVFDLVGDLIADSAEATVPATIRETVQAVERLQVDAKGGVSLVKLAAALKLDKSAASRRGKAAREAGYLINLEERLGRPARYTTDEPLPEQCDVLPTPDRLRQEVAP